jgi:hypothetical protein
LLATINDLPVSTNVVTPSKGFVAKGNYRRFLTHSVVTLAQRCVMVEAAPASPLEVAKADLLFEFVVVALNAPLRLNQRPRKTLGFETPADRL